MIGILSLRDKSVAMPQDQGVEVTSVDVVAAVANGLAVRPIAMHWLVTGCNEPLRDGL